MIRNKSPDLILLIRVGGFLLFLLPQFAGADDEFTPDDTNSASGYAAGKGCPGGMEGPNEAANPAAGKPQDKTWEGKSGGKPVMVAVKPSESQIMQALCPGRALGAEIEAGDICPICESLKRLDFSHKECKDMGSTSGPIVIEWRCKEAGKKAGDDEKLQARNQPDPSDAGISEKPRIDCEEPEALGAKIDFCTQNRVFKDKAKDCKNKIDQAWQAAGPELAKVLAGNKTRNFTRQQSELAYTEGDYEKAKKKLRALLAATREALDKVARYPTVMVDNLPHSRPWCFKDNKEAVRQEVKEIDDKIDQGLMAFNESERLHDKAEGRDVLLVHQYGGDSSFQGQKHANTKSDITGGDEDAAKRRMAGSRGRNYENKIEDPRLQDPKFEKHPGINAPSDITRSNDRPLLADGRGSGVDTHIAPSGVFTSRGALAIDEASARATGAPGGKAGSAAETSVGAALFHVGKEGPEVVVPLAKNGESEGKPIPATGKAATLVLAEAAAKDATAAPGFIVAMLTDLGEAGAVSRAPASLHERAGLAGADVDLFRIVSERYRSTELFRTAHVEHVPLQAFEANLKR